MVLLDIRSLRRELSMNVVDEFSNNFYPLFVFEYFGETFLEVRWVVFYLLRRAFLFMGVSRYVELPIDSWGLCPSSSISWKFSKILHSSSNVLAFLPAGLGISLLVVTVRFLLFLRS